MPVVVSAASNSLKKLISLFSKKSRIESFKKTMAAKKKRREYEKSPAGQEENRKRIEKMKKAHARRRWLNENVRDQ